MKLHLIKLCVGIDDVEQLADSQRRRLKQARAAGTVPELKHLTRHRPKRAEELLDGGSLYWVIRGVVRVRQRLLELRQVEDAERGNLCAMVLDHTLVPTYPRRFRAFQGWRYFPAADAPADAPPGWDGGDVPPEMESELRELGLL